MKVVKPITDRKIGALEVLVAVIVFEVLSEDFFAALLFMGLAIAFYLGRAHLGGDFSLAQLYGLFATKENQEK